MVTKTIERYDHPNATVRREMHSIVPAGGAAADIAALFFSYQLIRMKRILAVSRVAGTNAINTAIVRGGLAGTTILGSILLGTDVVGTLATVTLTSDLAANSILNITKGADLTIVLGIAYEYEVLPGAVVTV